MQKNEIQKYLLSIIFGITVYCFFYLYYPYHLHYQEQFQLFLFTKTYFYDTCFLPGGLSNYIGRFLVQFFVDSWLGALIVSLLIVCIQLNILAVLKRFMANKTGDIISFLPAIFYWYLLCDENIQLGGIIALLLSLVSTLTVISIKSHIVRRICFLIMIPLLYYLAGGVVCLSIVLFLLYEWLKVRSSIKSLISISVISVLFAFVCPVIAKYILVQYPVYRFYWGVDYVHFTAYPPYIIIYLWGMIILFTAFIKYIPEIKKIKPWISFSVNLVILMIVSCFFINKTYIKNLSKEEIMAYDYHCRMKNWNEIIKMADRKAPSVPMTVSCLNLALYKTGQLPDKMFNYFQNGTEGLLPSFQRDFMIPMVAGEPYYYLGFVNVAQRFAFESMEAIPDHQKSARCLKRLVETNLINGNYSTAEKYISILENTLFYRKWARYARTFLYDDSKIESHSEWGEIRQFRINKDFLFSDNEKDMMLGLYFEQNRGNRMAYEYLMAYTLLTKDIKNFPVYFQLKKDFSYSSIPKSYQEAIVYIWGLTNKTFDSIPFNIDNRIMQDVNEYAQIYTNVQSPEAVLRQRFLKTYWYYLHFRQYNKVDTYIHYQY